MNRAERRRMQKSEEKIRRRAGAMNIDIDQLHQEALAEVMTLLFAIPLKVAKETLGFGAVRLERFGEAITDEYQRFVEGDMSLKEYKDWVFDTVGWSFERGD